MEYFTNQAGRTAKLAVALACSAFVAACGGGGGSTSGSGTQAQVAVNPYTGQAIAATDQTTNVSGRVMATQPVVGSVVTAYDYNVDGTDGALLGTSAPTDSTGAYTIALSHAPTGLVHFVAAGGRFTSVDNTSQKVSTLELIAPYVTAEYNQLFITPVTHIGSVNIKYQLTKGGQTVPAEFNTGCGAAFFLTSPDTPLSVPVGTAAPADACVKTLALQPRGAADTLQAYSDLITDIEWGAVEVDVPSRVMYKTLALNAQGGYRQDTSSNVLDAAGNPLNAGNWVGGVYDENAPRLWSAILPSHGGTLITDAGNYAALYYGDKICTGQLTTQALSDRFGAGKVAAFQNIQAAGGCDTQPDGFANGFQSAINAQFTRFIPTNNRTLHPEN